MNRFFFILALPFLFVSCKKNKSVLSSNKSIISFDLKAASNTGVLALDIRGRIVGDSIFLGLPITVPVTALTPSITFTGQSVSPATGVVQNFSNPVNYTVAAEDKSTHQYTVVVRRLSNIKDILSFSFKASDNAGILMNDAKGIIDGDTIRVTVDAFNIAALVPSITHGGAGIIPSASNSANFTKPVGYTVIAEDGTTKKYTVVVRSSASLFIGGQDGYLYAFDAATGKLKWKYLLNLPVLTSPTFANGTVYIGSGSFLFAIDGATGYLKWQTNVFGTAGSSPQVADGLVYIAASRTGYSSGFMLAIDAITGDIRWKQPLLTDFVSCNPTVADGRVITADFSWGLHCFDAVTGTPLWNFSMGIIKDNPVMVNGTVYLGSENYKMIAIDAVTGTKKWAIPSTYDNNQFIHGVGSSPTVYNGTLYTGGGEGYLYAYDTASGSIKWKYPLTSGIINPVGENEVIFGNNLVDIVYAINTDGTLKWTYGTISFTNVSVERHSSTVAHGVVFSGNGYNHDIVALNAATGQLMWSYEGTAPFSSGPCVVDGQGKVFHSAVSGAQQ